MKQLFQNFKSGKLSIEDIPAPALRSEGVIVRNHFSVISAGTERSGISFARKGMLGKARSRPDLARQVVDRVRKDGLLSTYRNVVARLDSLSPMGYSSAGVVLEVGDRVSALQVGDAVACAGSGYASHAEIVYVPQNLTARIPAGLSTRYGAFATLGAIAQQGIRRAELSVGEVVAVMGLGLVGQLTVQILLGYGFRVVGFDIDKAQVELAMNIGLDSGVIIGQDDAVAKSMAASDGHGLDAVIITAATTSSEPLELAGEVLRDRGKVSVVGDVGMNVPRRLYYAKELDLRISRSYGPGRYDPVYEEQGIDYPIGYVRWTVQRNMEEFLRVIGNRQNEMDSLITHSFPIDRGQDAYRLVVDNPDKERFLGVLIEYPSATESPSRRIDIHVAKRTRPAAGQVRVGLIGTGSFARSTIIPALTKISNVHLRATASANGISAKEVAEKHGCDYATTDYRELLDDADLDLIVVATRHNLHASIAAESLIAGKHTFVEKPLALDREGLAAVAQAEKQSSAMLMVGFNRRFAPTIETAMGHFADRQTPLLMHYRVNAGAIPPESWIHDPVEGGGRILGEVCHFVDLLQHFAGASPTSVYAVRLPAVGNQILSDDNLQVVLRFADGSLGTILYTALGPGRMPKEYLEIMGDGRAATIDDFARLTLHDDRRSTNKKSRSDKGHDTEFERLIDAIASGGPPPIPVSELLGNSLATICIVESLSSNTPVPIDAGMLHADEGASPQRSG